MTLNILHPHKKKVLINSIHKYAVSIGNLLSPTDQEGERGLSGNTFPRKCAEQILRIAHLLANSVHVPLPKPESI
jgi:hypothetical protein